MKFQLGSLTVSIDVNQIFQGQGATIHVNGQIRPDLEMAMEFSWLPMSTEKINVMIKVNEVKNAEESAIN